MTDSNHKIVIIDVDEVLLRWVDGLSLFLHKYWGIETEGLPTNWEVHNWLGCSKETAAEFIRSFNEESDEFGELRPFPGADVALRDLMESGYKLYCVTSSCEGPEGRRNRIYNLLEHFGNVFEDVYFLPLGACKYDVLKQFPAGSYLIEDNMVNLVVGGELGFKTIQFLRPHNERYWYNHSVRLEHWGDVLNHIKGDSNED